MPPQEHMASSIQHHYLQLKYHGSGNGGAAVKQPPHVCVCISGQGCSLFFCILTPRKYSKDIVCNDLNYCTHSKHRVVIALRAPTSRSSSPLGLPAEESKYFTKKTRRWRRQQMRSMAWILLFTISACSMPSSYQPMFGHEQPVFGSHAVGSASALGNPRTLHPCLILSNEVFQIFKKWILGGKHTHSKKEDGRSIFSIWTIVVVPENMELWPYFAL